MNRTLSVTVGSEIEVAARRAVRLDPGGAAFRTVTWTFTVNLAPGATTFLYVPAVTLFVMGLPWFEYLTVNRLVDAAPRSLNRSVKAASFCTVTK